MFSMSASGDDAIKTECELREQGEIKRKRFLDDLADILDVLKYALISGIIAYVLTRFICPVAFIPTTSMENTIPAGSLVICSKVDYWFSEPQRGDAVIFKRDGQVDDEKIYAKRIVGEPGDEILIQDGITYINGEAYDEPWLKETPEAEDYGPFEVPEGKYFLMGDNRNNSFDCRFWEEHYVDEDGIIAKIRVVASTEGIGLIETGDVAQSKEGTL